MIYYYERTHESVTMHVNLFTSGTVPYSWVKRDGIDTTNRGTGDYVTVDSASGLNLGSSGENTVKIDVSCGCMRVAFNLDEEDTFYAWSFGFEQTSEDATLDAG